MGLLDIRGGVWVVIMAFIGGKPQMLDVTLCIYVGESPIYNYLSLTTKSIFHIKTKYILA